MQEYEERGRLRLWLLQAAFSLDLTSASALPFSPLLPAPRALDSPISPLQESFGQEGPGVTRRELELGMAGICLALERWPLVPRGGAGGQFPGPPSHLGLEQAGQRLT